MILILFSLKTCKNVFAAPAKKLVQNIPARYFPNCIGCMKDENNEVSITRKRKSSPFIKMMMFFPSSLV